MTFLRCWTQTGLLRRLMNAGPFRRSVSGAGGDRSGGVFLASAGVDRRSETVVRPEPGKVRALTLQVFLGVSTSVLLLGWPCKADVWEFDRQGNVLSSPRAESPHNSSYDTSIAISRPQGAPVKSSRSAAASAHRAIYRPMAEGVAAVYAQDAAVAGAGLSQAEFVRVFVEPPMTAIARRTT